MKKGYSYSSKNKNGRRLCIKDQNGVTLVEVMIAFLVLVIVSLIMIQGIMIATRAAEINKAKTAAMAIASNEIEEIRLRDYGEVGIEGAPAEEPQGNIEAETIVDGYTVSRTITWVEGEYSYKQVEISAINDSMNEEVTIVTQVYPSFGEGGPPSATYPPPANLIIEYDFGFWIFRVVGLNWDAPDTETPIDNYRVFRDGSYIGSSNVTRYVDWPGNSQNHTYYVTVRYVGGTESERSNEVTTSR